MTEVVLATRNPGKVREIRAILEAVPGLSPVGLDALGIPETAEEDGLETAPTFAENALAKARYFAARTGRIVLADDSGLAVDALDGAPGVHSRRFAGADRLRGRGQDEANIQLLLERLDAVPDAGRTARFVCVMAVVAPDGREATFEGAVEGTILRAPRAAGLSLPGSLSAS